MCVCVLALLAVLLQLAHVLRVLQFHPFNGLGVCGYLRHRLLQRALELQVTFGEPIIDDRHARDAAAGLVLRQKLSGAALLEHQYLMSILELHTRPFEMLVLPFDLLVLMLQLLIRLIGVAILRCLDFQHAFGAR